MRTFLISTSIAALASATAVAQEKAANIGADEYAASCAVCHGEDGRGHGEFSRVLKVPPSDLTTLAKDNDGKFPFLDVFHIVDGRTLVDGHGTRDMPIWGRRYMEEVGEKFGPYGGEIAVRARVLELVHYIHSIQE